MDFGLTRITRLIRDYHTRLPWKAIHIAGTNGKGSTSAFLSGLLYKTGVVVGRFNSPHLIERHDCITIQEKTVNKGLFLEVEDVVAQRNSKAGIQATSFELLTATAFEIFARQKVAVAVVECGLGGARDATNVLTADEVICSVITPIGLDHQDLLGHDIRDIAQEKAGVVKKGVPVLVDGRNIDAVQNIFEQKARLLKSPLQISTRLDQALGIRSMHYSKDNQLVPKGLDIGQQLGNLALAYNAFMLSRLACAREDPRVQLRDFTPGEIFRVARRVRKKWRGRTEWISVAAIANRSTKVLVDGAHNAQATSKLRQYVAAQGGYDKPVTWVIAMSENKDVAAALRHLIKQGDKVVVTQFGPVDGMPWVRPCSLQTLREIASEITSEVKTSPIPVEALRTAVQITAEEDLIVVAGSLYLVGDILRIPEIAQAAV